MCIRDRNGKKKPGATDFITGAIKSNNPMMLKEFMGAFKHNQA